MERKGESSALVEEQEEEEGGEGGQEVGGQEADGRVPVLVPTSKILFSSEVSRHAGSWFPKECG